MLGHGRGLRVVDPRQQGQRLLVPLLAGQRPWCGPTSGGLLAELACGLLRGYGVQLALGLLAPAPLELAPVPLELAPTLLELALTPLELVPG